MIIHLPSFFHFCYYCELNYKYQLFLQSHIFRHNVDKDEIDLILYSKTEQ